MGTENEARATERIQHAVAAAQTATRIGLVAFAALVLVWFTQVKPKYEQLTESGYAELTGVYAREREKLRERSDIENASRQGPSGEDGQASAYLARRDAINRELSEIRKEREALLPTVDFELFDLRAPLSALRASSVWQMVFVVLLMYMARARYRVLAACVQGVKALRECGVDPSVHSVAGPVPFWLAPLPDDAVQPLGAPTGDLLRALDWAHLRALPVSLAAIGLLVALCVQLDVTATSLELLRKADWFSVSLRAGSADAAQLVRDGVTVSSVWAAELTLLHLFSTAITALILVLWFQRGTSSSQGYSRALPMQTARIVLGMTAAGLAAALVTVFAAQWVLAVLSPAIQSAIESTAIPVVIGAAAAIAIVELVQLSHPEARPATAQTGPIAEPAHAESTSKPVDSSSPTPTSRAHGGEAMDESAHSWTRRHVIAALAGGVVLPTAIAASELLRRRAGIAASTSRTAVAPLARQAFQQTNLEPGFYVLRPRRELTPLRLRRKLVVHYVDEGKRLLYADVLDPGRLRKVELDTLAGGATRPPIANTEGKYRVNARRSAEIFEREALRLLLQGTTQLQPGIKPSQAGIEAACQCLITGIRHDLEHKMGNPTLGIAPQRHRRPSMRLYDLLAVVAIRYERNDALATLRHLADETTNLIESGRLETPENAKAKPFSHRLQVWTDPTSKKHQIVKNREVPFEWALGGLGNLRYYLG